MLRIPFPGLAKTRHCLVSERRAGVFCTSREDDFSSVLGSQPCPVAVSAVPVVSSSPAEQLGGLWYKYSADPRNPSETEQP